MGIYKQLGALAARYRIVLVILWIGLALAVGLFAPRITQVTTSDISTFLPADAPFREAARVLAETYPNDSSGSSYLIAIEAPDGVLNPGAEDFAGQLDTAVGRWLAEFKTWLQASEIAADIARITSPTDSALLAQQLVAESNQVALVNISLTGSGTAKVVKEALLEYRSTNTPEGVRTYITGGTAITQSTAESSRETAESTLVVTVVLVIVLLLLIYRSPVSPLLPLGAVTLAYIIAQGVVAWLSQQIGMSISTYANVLLVVVLFGAGTDYCLFLISRYREEMADTPDPKAATTSTLAQVGETLVSSAGTIFVGFIAMSFAEMGLFRTAGPVLAIGIVIMLLVGVTFVPALLALLGKRAFWPGKAVHRPTGNYYERISQLVSSRPALSVVVIIALMLPLALYGLSTTVSYDLIGDLPVDDPAVAGYGLVRDNFGAGTIMPLTVVVTGRDAATVASEIDALAQQLAALPTVGDVRSIDDPLGQNGSIRNLTRVDGQLTLILDQLDGAGGGTGGANLVAVIGALQSYLDLLAQTFPTMAADPNLTELQTLLSNPLQLALQRDKLRTDLEGLAATFATMNDAYLMPTALTPLLASADEAQAALIDQLNNTYLANDGSAYRINVIVNVNPNSDAALDTVQQIRALLPRYEDGSQAVLSGQPVTLADIRDTMNRDLLRTMALVILGIFIVLLFMLRSLIAPIYLILTVIITYAFSLGLTDLVFRLVLGVESLSWYMPFFTLIFLVALGVDYSIFLIGRVKEEVPRHGTRAGVHKAVAATGAIITSAGLILAGTFAALLTGSIMGLIQLGFAVAFGVLVDTFVVRTMLVPAITVLLDKFAWWPGNLAHAVVKEEAEPVA
ncbi:MAG: MMPL family transporter [Chloroflexi bacterium]|uniref:MMPL family transporter n=1 Tax=Candidatus Flexifilum breve TaxID=3140694 RepID=UPI003134BE4F|nr:MMPL family transporter [Chloroflexota bacterium]